jgi:hypothetical protein
MGRILVVKTKKKHLKKLKQTHREFWLDYNFRLLFSLIHKIDFPFYLLKKLECPQNVFDS